MTIAPYDLAHVYWIGGSPCSGKSSIAQALAETYEMEFYQADDAYVRHAHIVTPDKEPIFSKLVHLSPDELWMRDVEEQFVEELALYREEFPLILDDLLRLPTTRPVLAEGAALLPECVVPLLLEPRQAIWIVPTPAFQVEHYTQRAWAKDVVKFCRDPEQAFHNWMQRDIRFARHVERTAGGVNMRTLIVDGACSLIENQASVEHHFQLVPAHCEDALDGKKRITL